MRKFILLYLLFAITAILLLGCKNQKVTAKNESLSDYEKGQELLKNTFLEDDALSLALKNIGNTPDIVFKDINGNTVSLKEFTGKRMVLEIIQNTCSYCKKQVPITHKFTPDDVLLIPIFVNSTKSDIKNFYKELNIALPNIILLDPQKKVVNEFHLKKTPTSVFIDEFGKISFIRQTTYTKKSYQND